MQLLGRALVCCVNGVDVGSQRLGVCGSDWEDWGGHCSSNMGGSGYSSDGSSNMGGRSSSNDDDDDDGRKDPGSKTFPIYTLDTPLFGSRIRSDRQVIRGGEPRF